MEEPEIVEKEWTPPPSASTKKKKYLFIVAKAPFRDGRDTEDPDDEDWMQPLMAACELLKQDPDHRILLTSNFAMVENG